MSPQNIARAPPDCRVIETVPGVCPGAGSSDRCSFTVWAPDTMSARPASITGFTLSWACAKEVNRPRYAGMATGLANTGGFLAAGILQPLVGWVLDRTSTLASEPDFRPALAMLALFALSGLAGALFIRETRCRNIWAPANQQTAR